MNKIILSKDDIKSAKLLETTQFALIFRQNDGSILKMFHPDMLRILKSAGVDIEAKILDAKPINDSPEILTPTTIVYDRNGIFQGYTMQFATGINYNQYNYNFSIKEREDLEKFADIHFKLESILRRNPNMVFPDFCTCDNIFIDSNGNIQLIDYDGIQVDRHRTLSISTALGELEGIVKNTKYCDGTGFFTKQLDVKSSIFLYFLTAFNIDLKKVGTISQSNGKVITLDDIFSLISLDDLDLCHKVWKIFQDGECNEFLEEDVFRIADKYDMKVLAAFGNCYIKTLKRKR